jgi:hypothetical protein
MLLNRATGAVLIGLALFLTSAAATGESEDPPATSFTGSAEAGTGTAAVRVGYYHNPDHGDGNPFLDEKLTVVEPIFIVDYNVTDRLAATGQFSYDYVSSASIDRLSDLEDFDNQSGASGDNYVGFDLGARYELDQDQRVGGYFSLSTEYDYTSYGVGGDYARDFANKDATVKLSMNGYYDELDVIIWNGEEPGDDERVSISTTLTWYQIINPRVHADMGATFGYQNGFLETPYNAVVIEDSSGIPNEDLDNRASGTQITEELPKNRSRGSLFGRTRYSLTPETALEMGGRLYLDDWGIFGFTAEPLVHYWPTKQIGMRLGYRYYIQTDADDYKDHFTEVTSKRTQDSDLANFDSHGILGALVWQPLETLSLDVTAGYTLRSDGIDQLMLSFGIRTSFDARPLKEMVWGP